MKTELLNLSPEEFCRETNVCEEGKDFALQYETMAEGWEKCERSDWLLWIIDKVGLKDDRALRLFAVWCARSCNSTDPRSIAAIDCAERFANGQASEDDLLIAKLTPVSFTSPALTAAYAAAYAAYAAYDAAYAAAYAAAGYDAAARKAQADYLRTLISNPFKK